VRPGGTADPAFRSDSLPFGFPELHPEHIPGSEDIDIPAAHIGLSAL
jgi:hypothetical protein